MSSIGLHPPGEMDKIASTKRLVGVGQMYWTLAFVFAALVLAFGFSGWKWPKAPLWKAVDIAYYLLGGIGVILLAASTQRDAALADINYNISKAEAALAQAQAVRSLTADEVLDVDKKTRSIFSDVVGVISKSACTVRMPEDAGPRRNAPTACALREGLKFSVERILGMKNDSDQPSPVIASDGATRCRAVIEIQKEFAATERIADINQITGLVLSYPPELVPSLRRVRKISRRRGSTPGDGRPDAQNSSGAVAIGISAYKRSVLGGRKILPLAVLHPCRFGLEIRQSHYRASLMDQHRPGHALAQPIWRGTHYSCARERDQMAETCHSLGLFEEVGRPDV